MHHILLDALVPADKHRTASKEREQMMCLAKDASLEEWLSKSLRPVYASLSSPFLSQVLLSSISRGSSQNYWRKLSNNTTTTFFNSYFYCHVLFISLILFMCSSGYFLSLLLLVLYSLSMFVLLAISTNSL